MREFCDRPHWLPQLIWMRDIAPEDTAESQGFGWIVAYPEITARRTPLRLAPAERRKFPIAGQNEAAGAADAAMVAAEQFGGWYKDWAEARPPRVDHFWKSPASSAARASGLYSVISPVSAISS